MVAIKGCDMHTLYTPDVDAKSCVHPAMENGHLYSETTHRPT